MKLIRTTVKLPNLMRTLDAVQKVRKILPNENENFRLLDKIFDDSVRPNRTSYLSK